MYVTRNIKPTITTRQYLLGYKYNFEMIYSYVVERSNLSRHLLKMKDKHDKS